MTEIERHPQAVRQAAAAAAVAAVTVGVLPIMASRAADQRDAADLAEKAQAYSQFLKQSAAASNGATVRVASLETQAASARPFSMRARSLTKFAPEAFHWNKNLLVTASFSPPTQPLLAPLVPLEPLSPSALAPARVAAKEQHCLAEAIYYEARGESRNGQIAVAEVVRNRVHSGIYPTTYCGVVYQGSNKSSGCQFSFTCNGALNSRARGAAWRQAQAIASQMFSGAVSAMTGGATHYHTVSVEPYWRDSLVETARIGSHIFYRRPSLREKALLVAGRATAADEAAVADIDTGTPAPVMRTLPPDPAAAATQAAAPVKPEVSAKLIVGDPGKG